MNKKLFAVALAFLTFIMVIFAASTQNSQSFSQENINEIYVFGDSLSDTGNIFKATNGVYPPSPPYFQGRYSNGPVWVEHLGTKLGLNPSKNINFALGGATTINGTANGILGALAQVNSYTKSQPKINPNALYILWAGANDYLYGTTSTNGAIANLSNALDSLLTAGAKTVLVANLPDLGKIPATYNTAKANSLSAVTNQHNLELSKSVNSLQQKFGSGKNIIQFDTNRLYRDAITQPAQFGFTNVTASCLSSVTSCNNPDQFLFWDAIHPTTAAHRILADAALKAISVTR
ncbi:MULTISPECIES: SGNH/GDSL hydrolase family protein [Calothrix]|uniref:SGNH/GDSL hydrolase family protein n=2 Tax=Calothrix TaxID=1186 RepID=A0ABR8ABD2_9CYAN|nr:MULTISPECIES: SGNH/GDSL hydrolase family protein [Calothrix]MBD2197189.1 SGNH/GDSL hydrolase family protein [Calothrix parietina FACHB-288]MBD2225835.1 SGNH/GDSL hydrolase family protein [Calothrix anomala FACHB-343]